MNRCVVTTGTLILVFVPGVAQAEDIWGARASGNVAIADSASLVGASLGGTLEFFVDRFGLRFGLDAGYTTYHRTERDPSLGFALEFAGYIGPDLAVLRPYLVTQWLTGPHVFEGLRLGPEIEWRDICKSHLRVALGAFYQPLRDAEGVDWLGFGSRLSVAWGMPTLGCVEVPICVELPGNPACP